MMVEPRRRDIVLIVDDSPDTLAMLIDALEGAGTTTLVARDGAAALGVLDRMVPDLVLLDAVMPGIDGFETCRRMKQRTDMAITPVVFMTGLSAPGHVLEGLRAGGGGLCGKADRSRCADRPAGRASGQCPADCGRARRP